MNHFQRNKADLPYGKSLHQKKTIMPINIRKLEHLQIIFQRVSFQYIIQIDSN